MNRPVVLTVFVCLTLMLSGTPMNSLSTSESSSRTLTANPELIFFSGATFVQVSAAHSHTCGLTDEGEVHCWGFNDYGQLGIGVGADQTEFPALDFNGSSIVKISQGFQDKNSCAISTTGGLYCWGWNTAGQLGLGYTSSNGGSASPVLVSSSSNQTWVDVQVGNDFVCAIDHLGDVYCWGDGGNYRTGLGSTTKTNSPTKVNIGTGRTALRVAAGHGHACAILDDSTLKCWGDNGLGQLGVGGTTSKSTPQSVNLGSNVGAMNLTLGTAHTCVITNTSDVKCWGSNTYYNIGKTSGGPYTTPTSVTFPTGTHAVRIDAGNQHTCAVLNTSSLYCWGMNDYLQVGEDFTSKVAPPAEVDVGYVRSAVEFSAGRVHSCVLSDDHSIRCWGESANSRL